MEFSFPEKYHFKKLLLLVSTLFCKSRNLYEVRKETINSNFENERKLKLDTDRNIEGYKNLSRGLATRQALTQSKNHFNFSIEM